MSASGLYIDPSTGQANINMAPFRNRFINGDMRINQRNSSGIFAVSGYGVDRWKVTVAGGGQINMQQVTTVPTNAFTNSLQSTVTSTDTSLASSDKYDIRQTIEGNNVYDFGLGTSAALPFTVSFWVRASIAGAYALAFQNGAGNRSYVTSYTIDAINTWEFKIISLTGDVTGTWADDNGAGLAVIWGLSQNGSGTQTTTLNAWQPGALTSFTSAVNWIGTSGATFLITGAQIEKGTTASAYEVRNYTTEMALCSRYYQILSIGANAYTGVYNTTNTFYGTALTFSRMRTTPTPAYQYGGSGGQYWVQPGVSSYSANTSSFITVSATNGSVVMKQTRTSATGAIAPTLNQVYNFEAIFNILLDAEI